MLKKYGENQSDIHALLGLHKPDIVIETKIWFTRNHIDSQFGSKPRRTKLRRNM